MKKDKRQDEKVEKGKKRHKDKRWTLVKKLDKQKEKRQLTKKEKKTDRQIKYKHFREFIEG